MSALSQQESLVKESLFQFIAKCLPSADVSGIDEIVLSYVISILEEASEDPCFDVEGFMEMMAGYVPGFDAVDHALVCQWLQDELTRHQDTDSVASQDSSSSSDRLSMTLQTITDMLPPAAKTIRSHSNSESSCSSGCGSAVGDSRQIVDCEEYTAQCNLLAEMFPSTCAMEIKHSVSIANGDIEEAAATLLHRIEQGTALSSITLPCGVKQPVCNDDELKNRIIERYSYVDKNAEQKEHRPLAPKFEPKKMVRYRDNKIVSLKGERYTEVPKSGSEDENVKKPKKQHCP